MNAIATQIMTTNPASRKPDVKSVGDSGKFNKVFQAIGSENTDMSAKSGIVGSDGEGVTSLKDFVARLIEQNRTKDDILNKELLQTLKDLTEELDASMLGLELGQLIESYRSHIAGGLESEDPSEYVRTNQLLDALQAKLNSQQTTKGVDALNRLHSMIQYQQDQEVKMKNDEKFMQMFSKIESLLKASNQQDTLTKNSPQILEHLKEWINLEKRQSQDGIKVVSTDKKETDAFSLWKNLVESYERRQSFANIPGYNSEAEVTSKDVAKWLNNHTSSQPVVIPDTNIQTVMSGPMSKLEQYVIHINEADNVAVDKQLIKQFENIMKTGRFNMNEGFKQFTIALRPDNLGELMVRLTEVEGEMTLKILVSSQTTKQMLEGNIKELRSMFSPHQVVIEKQDGELAFVEHESSEETFEDQQDNQSNQSSRDQHGNESELSFAEQFEEMLMDMKV